jgi:hypothetical protein
VVRAQADLLKAQQQDKGEADLKAIERAIQLRDAYDAVADAQAKIAPAQTKDAADERLRALQESQQLRQAHENVAKAIEGVAQAHRNAASDAIKDKDANLSLLHAKEALDDAQKKQADALAKVADAQEKLKKEQEQGQRALDAIAAKVKGAADAQAEGWIGSLNRIKVAITNWLGHFGDAGGKFLIFAYPILSLLKGMGGALFGGGAAAEAGVVVAEGAGGGGLIAGLGTLAAAAAPVLLVVAAVAAVGAAFYLAYTRITPFRDVINEIGDFFAGTFHSVLTAIHEPLDRMSKLWGTITKDLEHLGHDVLTFFQNKLNDVNKFLKDHRAEIEHLTIVVGEIGNVLKGIATFIATGWTVALNIVVTVWKVTWDVVYTVLKVTWDLIKGTISIALDIIMGIIGIALDLLSGHWGKAWHDLWNMVDSVFRDIFNTIFAVLGDVVTGIVKTGGDIIKGLWHGIQDTFNLIFDLPGMLWRYIIKPILEFFGISSPSRRMHDLGADIIHGLLNGIAEAFNGVTNFFSQVGRWIWDALKHLWEGAGDMVIMGKNIIIGLLNGMASMAGDIGNAAFNVGKNILDTVSNFFGIGSPSRLMHQHGQWIVEGLANGILDNAPMLNAAMNSLHRQVADHPVLNTRAAFGFDAATRPVGASGVTSPGVGNAQVVVQNFTVPVEVQGSLIHSDDLAYSVKTAVVSAGRRSGGNFFEGVA